MRCKCRVPSYTVILATHLSKVLEMVKVQMFHIGVHALPFTCAEFLMLQIRIMQTLQIRVVTCTEVLLLCIIIVQIQQASPLCTQNLHMQRLHSGCKTLDNHKSDLLHHTEDHFSPRLIPAMQMRNEHGEKGSP
jgi:hypothetical protein